MNKSLATCQTGYLLESKTFHIRYAVSDDFIKVYDFSNESVTSRSAWPETKLFADNIQVVMFTDQNDNICCFICWYKYIALLNILSWNTALKLLDF